MVTYSIHILSPQRPETKRLYPNIANSLRTVDVVLLNEGTASLSWNREYLRRVVENRLKLEGYNPHTVRYRVIPSMKGKCGFLKAVLEK